MFYGCIFYRNVVRGNRWPRRRLRDRRQSLLVRLDPRDDSTLHRRRGLFPGVARTRFRTLVDYAQTGLLSGRTPIYSKMVTTHSPITILSRDPSDDDNHRNSPVYRQPTYGMNTLKDRLNRTLTQYRREEVEGNRRRSREDMRTPRGLTTRNFWEKNKTF